jgi:dTDP-4-amino-4,6-dideoxygalactose transaminase
MQKAYIDPRYKKGDFPVTEWLSENVVSLPIHTELNEQIQKEICDAVLEYVNK